MTIKFKCLVGRQKIKINNLNINLKAELLFKIGTNSKQSVYKVQKDQTAKYKVYSNSLEVLDKNFKQE